MRKKIISIAIIVFMVGAIGVVLASNKAKIDKAAKPAKENFRIPVKVYQAKEEDVNNSFSINGTTSAGHEVQIASEVQGKLVGLYIKNGDMVGAGQVIATLDASVFNAQLNSTESAINKAQLDLARYTRLVEMGGATPMQVESVKLQLQSLVAQKKEVLQQMTHMQIRAPFSGKVENVVVERGSFVNFGTVLGELLDNSSLKVKVYLSEQEAFKITLGERVEINSIVLSQPKAGIVSMISDKADPSGKFVAEIKFSNTGDEKLKAGMLTDVTFNTGSTVKMLSIPASAITGSVNEAKVYVVKGSTVELRRVKTGVVTADKVEVLEGLQPGEEVVISGQLNLENGSAISIIK